MLHITFDGSGAGLLRRALNEKSLRQRVITFPDNLSFGPIDAYASSDRAKWADTNLLHLYGEFPAHWPSMDELSKEFWSLSRDSEECTIWMTRRTPREYCGFLAWLEQSGAKTYNVVDLTDATFVADGKLIFSLACADPARADYEDLFASAQPLPPGIADEYLKLWNRLCRENAGLRVLINSKLISVPIDFFDDLLLSFVRTDWQKANLIAVKAWSATLKDTEWQGEMEVMMARLFALVKAGHLESNGAFNDWWGSAEIRLPVALPR
jgi:hypothetical protein